MTFTRWKYSFFHIFFSLNRRTAGPIVKRIDNYGPPNAKSPFGASDEKSESKSDATNEETVIKKNESQSADEIAVHTADSSGKKKLLIIFEKLREKIISTHF